MVIRHWRAAAQHTAARIPAWVALTPCVKKFSVMNYFGESHRQLTAVTEQPEKWLKRFFKGLILMEMVFRPVTPLSIQMASVDIVEDYTWLNYLTGAVGTKEFSTGINEARRQ